MNSGQNVAFAREQVKDLGISELLLNREDQFQATLCYDYQETMARDAKNLLLRVNYFSCAEEYWWKDREFRNRVICECRKIRSYIEKQFISDISIVDGVVM
jgi:hypothetical protein